MDNKGINSDRAKQRPGRLCQSIMNPDPKIKPREKVKIDWAGFAVPKLIIKLSQHEYGKLKRKVHKLDGWRCINPDCVQLYTRKELTMHHIIPRARLRLDTVDNCATICFVCHMLVEAKILKLDFKKLLKERRRKI